MFLTSMRGVRSRFSWDEVCADLQMSREQVQRFVDRGDLVKRYFKCAYPFDQQDVNQFIVKFNAGKVS